MRSKQTATEAACRGTVTGGGTGARRRLARPLYVAFLLLAAFSVSGASCGPIGEKDAQVTLSDLVVQAGETDAQNAIGAFADQAQALVEELASPNPNLMDIGVKLDALDKYIQIVIDQTANVVPNRNDWPARIAAIKLWKADLTDQFDRLGGWGVANAQHQVLTSGGTWNWVTLGTNPDLNPGGSTFTGTTSPRGGNGCLPGHTFIIGVGCV